MPPNNLDPPSIDELEISLFGPSYGESIVVHIGNNRWVIVDSCLEPNSREPAPLVYLNEIGVNVEDSVLLIVATHWHDDHIRGLSSIFSECKHSRLVISQALLSKEFLKLVMIYSGGEVIENSGLDEFIRVLKVLESRKPEGAQINPPELASSDKLLYHDEFTSNGNEIEASIYSLSPSTSSVMLATLDFVKLFPVEGLGKKRISSISPNNASVVLWFQVGSHSFLLGADLEVTNDPNTGWSSILNDSTSVSERSSLFKVPHHGSENAHEDRVWNELLIEEPFALISSFNLGSVLLPTQLDIERIKSFTSNAYITSHPSRPRHRWSDKVVGEFLRDATRRIHDSYPGWGQIRLRQNVLSNSNSWHVELFFNASPL